MRRVTLFPVFGGTRRLVYRTPFKRQLSCNARRPSKAPVPRLRSRRRSPGALRCRDSPGLGRRAPASVAGGGRLLRAPAPDLCEQGGTVGVSAAGNWSGMVSALGGGAQGPAAEAGVVAGHRRCRGDILVALPSVRGRLGPAATLGGQCACFTVMFGNLRKVHRSAVCPQTSQACLEHSVWWRSMTRSAKTTRWCKDMAFSWFFRIWVEILELGFWVRNLGLERFGVISKFVAG